MEKLSEPITIKQAQQHIKNLKRKSSNSETRGNNHREKILEAIDNVMSTSDSSVDDTPLDPGEVLPLADTTSDDEPEHLSQRTQTIIAGDQKLLAQSATNSDELSSSGSYASWKEEQKSKKQKQWESNIAAKANKKKELTFMVQQQNEQTQEANKKRDQIESFIDIFKSYFWGTN